MKSCAARWPLIAPLLFSMMPLSAVTAAGQEDVSDAMILRAISAAHRADGYQEILETVERYESIYSSKRAAVLVDRLLRDPALDSKQRGDLLFARVLTHDCRQYGAKAAVSLLSVRIIAVAAQSSKSPEQLALVMKKFSPVAAEMDARLVKVALDVPGLFSWPAGFLPLMEQLGREWPKYGALTAAKRLVAAAAPAPAPAPAQTSDPGRAPGLAGHWRNTKFIYGSTLDENMILRADGSAETWTVTVSKTSGRVRGRWSTEAKTLSVDWEDGKRWSRPFTFHEGQLVFPNIQNQRSFWDRVQ